MKIPSSLPMLVLCVALSAAAEAEAPFADSLIQSIDPSKRDEAAARLRQSFRMPDRKKWDDLVARLKTGLAESEAKAILRPWEKSAYPSHASIGHEYMVYKLDEVYMLSVTFRRAEQVVHEVRLTEKLRRYFVKPPPNFTGTWTNYYVNGFACSKIEYKEGRYDGTNRSFHSNGALAVEQHYFEGECHGTDTGYYPSGALHYTGQYAHGKRIGVWTHYNEDGSIKHTEKVKN